MVTLGLLWKTQVSQKEHGNVVVFYDLFQAAAMLRQFIQGRTIVEVPYMSHDAFAYEQVPNFAF